MKEYFKMESSMGMGEGGNMPAAATVASANEMNRAFIFLQNYLRGIKIT
jgi:hypothetical protein